MPKKVKIPTFMGGIWRWLTGKKIPKAWRVKYFPHTAALTAGLGVLAGRALFDKSSSVKKAELLKWWKKFKTYFLRKIIGITPKRKPPPHPLSNLMPYLIGAGGGFLAGYALRGLKEKEAAYKTLTKLRLSLQRLFQWLVGKKPKKKKVIISRTLRIRPKVKRKLKKKLII